MVRRFNLFEGSMSSRVQSIEGFNWFKLSNGLINLSVQFVQGFNWFNGSICSRVESVKELICLSIRVRI